MAISLFYKRIFCTLTASIVHLLLKYFYGSLNLYMVRFLVCYWVAEGILGAAKKNRVLLAQTFRPNWCWCLIYVFYACFCMMICCSDEVPLMVATLVLSWFVMFPGFFSEEFQIDLFFLMVLLTLVFKALGCLFYFSEECVGFSIFNGTVSFSTW